MRQIRDICLLQEPWCDRHGKPPTIPNFDLFTPTPNKPKCATYIRRTPGLTANITFTAKDSFLGTTITSTYQQRIKTFTLYNLYSPGRPEPFAEILNTIHPPNNCILMGDLNAHHTWWQGTLPQSVRTTRATHAIADWLETHNFHLHNKPGTPTHHPRNGGSPSTIDLCLSQGQITQSILSLAVNHNTTSDHSAITITLTLPAPNVQARRQWAWQKADWGVFADQVRSTRMDISNLQGKEDTLRAITNITTLIHQATKPAVPERKGRWKTEAPWWNHSLTIAKQAVKRADR